MTSHLFLFIAVSTILTFTTYAQYNENRNDNIADNADRRVLNSIDTYSWTDKSNYYFNDLKVHATQFLPKSCMKSLVIGKNKEFDAPKTDTYVQITSHPPHNDMQKWWKSIPRPKQMRVDPYLCEAVYRSDRPYFANSGCTATHVMHVSSPRCQPKYLEWACNHAKMNITEPSYPKNNNNIIKSKSTSFSFFSTSKSKFQPNVNSYILPESDHSYTYAPPVPWLLTLRNSLVSMCGTIISKCGVVDTTANCLANGNKAKSQNFVKSCNLPKNPFQVANLTLCSSESPYPADVQFHKKVFVLAQSYDSHMGHLLLEVFPRMIYHLDFLLQNRDIRVLIGCDAIESSAKQFLNQIKPFMDIIGFPIHRIEIHKNIFAHTVYLPMEGACQDPVYNTWQLLQMRNVFLSKAYMKSSFKELNTISINPPSSTIMSLKSSHIKKKGKVMIIQRAQRRSKRIIKSETDNAWADVFTHMLVDALNKTIGSSYDIMVFNDKNNTMMRCYTCQIQAFHETDVLIGMHGAELANSLYLKPNSAVIEIATNHNDGRMLLGGGQYSRLASMLGNNYMMHLPKRDEIHDAQQFDVDRFVLHVASFLRGINFI